jgi:hypothetical protein
MTTCSLRCVIDSAGYVREDMTEGARRSPQVALRVLFESAGTVFPGLPALSPYQLNCRQLHSETPSSSAPMSPAGPSSPFGAPTAVGLFASGSHLWTTKKLMGLKLDA